MVFVQEGASELFYLPVLAGPEIQTPDNQNTNQHKEQRINNLAGKRRRDDIALKRGNFLSMAVDKSGYGLFPRPDFSQRATHETNQDCHDQVMVSFEKPS